MLSRIIKNKRKEVELSKKNLPLHSFKNKLKSSKRDFKKALSGDGLSLIAEIKRKSPSRKVANSNFDIRETAKIYGRYANAISVLTDKKFFDGSLADLKIVSELTKLPILRKDFIIDEYQIYESRLYNADAILLIAAVLSKHELNRFIRIAESYNMDCLVEINTKEELSKTLESDAGIIGINNRNLNTLKIDTGTTLRLADKIPKSRVIVSESGISSKSYISKLKGKVNAMLVGTALIGSRDLEKEIKGLIK